MAKRKVPKARKPAIETEEMVAPVRVIHVATKRGSIAKWAAVNGLINSILLVAIFITDGPDRANALKILPAILDEIAARLPLVISVGSALGLAVSAFRQHAYNERSTDR